MDKKDTVFLLLLPARVSGLLISKNDLVYGTQGYKKPCYGNDFSQKQSAKENQKYRRFTVMPITRLASATQGKEEESNKRCLELSVKLVNSMFKLASSGIPFPHEGSGIIWHAKHQGENAVIRERQ